MMATGLSGRRVLLVEDEYFIAAEMGRAFEEAGIEVLGPVGHVAEAMALIGKVSRLDGAVLDVNLHDVMVFPVADALRARGVPFVFVTGYESSMIPTRFQDVRRCEKPVTPDTIGRALFG